MAFKDWKNEWSDGCKMRPEAATRSDSLYFLFGQGFFNFYQG